MVTARNQPARGATKRAAGGLSCPFSCIIDHFAIRITMRCKFKGRSSRGIHTSSAATREAMRKIVGGTL